ncbi:MAG TPA: hypothetical protein PKV70_08755 [Thermodesulfobacteriota bacterium]|nr:hypothetical protein [Thermodesulfobacteriota bacterium]HQU14324.1 hypothetical protein [Thermodesulfobacteriota bacterium]
MPNKKPNIYPPSIIDPLKPHTPSIPPCTEKPGGIPSSPDPCAKPDPYTFREENGIRIPTHKPLTGTMVNEANMLRDVPLPDAVALARDRYLGDLAKDSLAAAEDAGEVEPDEDPQR